MYFTVLYSVYCTVLSELYWTVQYVQVLRRCPLHAAAEKGFDSIVQLLLGTQQQSHIVQHHLDMPNVWFFPQNYRWQNEKVRFCICLHLKVALPCRIEESSSRQEGRVSSRQQIV